MRAGKQWSFIFRALNFWHLTQWCPWFFSQQWATFASCEELSCPQRTEVMPPNLHLWCSNGPCRPILSLPTKDHSHPASFEKGSPGYHSTSCTGQWESSKNKTDKKPHFQFQCSLFMFLIIYVYLIISLCWFDIGMSNYSSRYHFQWHIYIYPRDIDSLSTDINS